MRHILVDYARARKMAKRGGVAHRVSLDEGLTIGPERGDDLVALDDALTLLPGSTSAEARSSSYGSSAG